MHVDMLTLPMCLKFNVIAKNQRSSMGKGKIMTENKDTKVSNADDALKIELRRGIQIEIEQLDALYDLEMTKYIDLERRIEKATKLGVNNEEVKRELALVQKTRRNLGEQTSYKRQELRDVDGPTLEEEYELYLAAELTGKAKVKKPPKIMKALPAGAHQNQQIDLFKNFLTNTAQERNNLSNAIDLWDSVPRYSISRARQVELRVEGGFLPIAELEFQYKGRPFTAEIHPALIKTKDKDGSATLAFYPSGREELVEHALRKLATGQQSGFLDADNFRSGVTFTLHQLRTELELRGHSMRYDELMESLDVMSLSNIRLIDKGPNEKDPSFISQPYLPTLIKVTKEGRAADPEAKWLVQFHSALTVSITQITYRQFNYQRLMNCQSQLTRWLISQLVLKYTFAALGNTFVMLYSTIRRDSRLLDNYKRTRDAISALDEAIAELKSEGLLMSFVKETRLGLRGKIEDVTYTLSPTAKFAGEQKVSNKRLGNNNGTLSKIVNNRS